MKSVELQFGVYLGPRRVKRITAKTVETIYKNYNKYCKSKGFVKQLMTSESFGNLAWQNPFNESYLVLRRES